MAPVQDLNRGMRCIKYLLFLFNLLFVITGILMIIIGVTIRSLYNDYISFLDNRYMPPTTFIIVIGAIIFVVAFFGCCGAIRESTCMIMLFSVMLGVIFVLEFSAGIAAYVLQNGLSEMLMNKVNTSMQMYGKDEALTQSLDFVQSELRCCGLNGYGDWEEILHTTSDSYSFPSSCCAKLKYAPQSNYNSNCTMVYANGCLHRLEFLLSESAFLLASAAIIIAVLQLLGVSFACSLGRSIRVHKTERERKRQELQERLLNSYSSWGKDDPKKTYPIYFMDNREKNYVE